MARKTRSTRRQKQKQSRKQKSQEGGARKTRKVGRKASSWAKAVGEMYRKMKKENPAVKLGDAMKAASKARAAGKL